MSSNTIKKEMTPLSPSRLKTLTDCAWKYWCKYKMKMPDKSNDGASRGTIVHLVAETLGRDDRKEKAIACIKNGVKSDDGVWAMIQKNAVKLKVNDKDNIDLIEQMADIMLRHDFFGDVDKPIKQTFDELKFDLTRDDEDCSYRILGFIDKTFVFEDGTVKVRDFKTSKSKFSPTEMEENLQDLIYKIASSKMLKKQIEDISAEFLFVKPDVYFGKGGGVCVNKPLTKEEMEGFENYLSYLQKIIDNFSEEDARSDYAYDKGFPKPEEGFCKRLSCGFAKYKGQLKKDGTLMFHCPFKFGFEYYLFQDNNGNKVGSCYLDEKKKLDEAKEKGYNISREQYKGCPKHSQL